jgi:hypothetical protein
MALRGEGRGWFERAMFDLSIAQAHLESGLWLEGGKLARQAAVKFLQTALVQHGEPNPSPRMGDLAAAVTALYPGFALDEAWRAFDAAAGATEMTEAAARALYAATERVRDAVVQSIR